MIKPIASKYTLLAVLVILAAAVVAIDPATSTSAPADGYDDRRPSRVVFQIEGMTCGGCAATIKSSLATFDGIKDIQVDVAAGKAAVLYDSRKIGDVESLAQAITASGYAASVVRVADADQLLREKQTTARKALKAIAAVGGLEIARTDFEAEMAHARSRYAAIYGASVMEGPQGKRLEDNLKRQVAQRLIEEGIHLQEIKRVGYRLTPADLDRAFDAYLEERRLTPESFEAGLEKNDMSLTYFKKKFSNRVLIRRYIDEEVLPAGLSDLEKQKRYADWFANARLMAGVTYYDPEIERLVGRPSAGGGCGASCSAGR